jgi:beta-lactamase superfamily II metal-dependent hydrolase
MDQTKDTPVLTITKFLLIIALIWITIPLPAHAAGVCGTGTWTPGTLEIHHINIGQGDSALIVSPTGKSLLFDVGESYWNSSADAQVIGPYIESVLGCKSLNYVVISHFHVDHIGYVGYGGLWHLVETQGFTVGTTLVRNYDLFLGDTSGTFSNWRTYLEGPGQVKLHPIFADEGSTQVNLGLGVTFDIVALDGNGAIFAGDFSADTSPPSENDYSIGAVLSYGNFDEWIGGDLDGEYQVSGFGYTYHDIELSTAPEVGDVDVYKANHHGSSHSSSATFINQLDPEVSIISVGNGNSYGHPTQTVMNRLLATSTVYLTERGNTSTNIGSAIVAGHIVIKTTNGSTYTVNGTQYTATEPARTDSDGDGYFAGVDPNDGNSSILPAPNGGCGPIYQNCSGFSVSCQATPGQVLINEFLPSPSNNGTEWVELYNTTTNTVNIGYCYIDDVAGGSAPYQIPSDTFIPPHGFWTLDRNSYFNNTGDDVRFLKEDISTVLDSYSYGSTGNDVSRYRLPDGGSWAGSATASTTKGQTNTLPFYPIVSSSVRADENPSSANSVNFTVTFSKPVSGVNTSPPFGDFSLTVAGVTGASISAVNGSGTTYTVTVNTGSGNGTIRLDVLDDDTIRDPGNHPLGGSGLGNGNFNIGQSYEMIEEIAAIIDVGPAQVGRYRLPSSPSLIASYANTLNGPVQVASSNTQKILPSQRVYYQNSFNELMGYPSNQFTTEFWFPWYDQVWMNTWILVGNPSATQTAYVDIYIGGVKRPDLDGQVQTYAIPPGGRVTPQFPSVLDGPVRVVSVTGNGTPSPINIFASERSLYASSFNEVMGFPSNKFTTEYWFPWYDQQNMSTWILVGNPDNTKIAYVDIYVGGVKVNDTSGGIPYAIPPNGRITPQYPGIVNGPLRVVSVSGAGTPSPIDIFASERSIYISSFNEVMGVPVEEFSTEYLYTWFDNQGLATWLLVGNPSPTQTAYVDLYIGGVKVNDTIGGIPYAIPPNGRITPQFNLNTGPVRVMSVTGSGTPMPINIFTSERSLYGPSFNEMMGYPANQLTTEYWFTWYDSVYMNTEIYVSKP